tara:strand:- start:75 stop:446 length:372 start_codon:yes stop_codon:yes gene_type:complete
LTLLEKINQKKWQTLVDFVSKNFGAGQTLDIQAILFLIGVNELGQGYRDFTKEEKIHLLHIAICKLLSRYNYYKYCGRDKDGWPHWETNKELPYPKAEEQTGLIKQSAILYFDESGITYGKTQ